MFVPVAFDSVNSDADMPPGVYDVVCRAYEAVDSQAQMVVFEYSPKGVDSVIAADLMVLDDAGNIRACDFVWLPDRSWRDSSGLKANHLAELLPPELLGCRLVRTESLGEQTVPFAAENSW